MPKSNKRAIESTEGETLVLEREKTATPRRYAVILHNDDYTTQEFVIHILINFFHKNREDAHRLMLKVHLEGKARVGVFTKDIAETKVALCTSYARQNGMPLMISAEPE